MKDEHCAFIVLGLVVCLVVGMVIGLMVQQEKHELELRFVTEVWSNVSLKMMGTNITGIMNSYENCAMMLNDSEIIKGFKELDCCELKRMENKK